MTLRRDVTLQFNSKNAPLADKSARGLNDRDPSSNSFRALSVDTTTVPASHASGTSANFCTTSANDIAVAQSDNMKSKSKKPTKKNRVIKITGSDSDTEDDDSLEREAALASPAKGVESRKATSTKVSKNFVCLVYV